MRTPTLAVRVQLPLGWNTYLLFNTDTVNFAWKTDEAESIVLLIFVLWRCLNLRWIGGGEGEAVSLLEGQLKSHLFPAGSSHI